MHTMPAVTKVIKLRPNMPEVDLQPKRDSTTRFLLGGDNVKVEMHLRGREIAHPKQAEARLIEFAQSLKDHCTFELPPTQDNTIFFLMLTPTGVKE